MRDDVYGDMPDALVRSTQALGAVLRRTRRAADLSQAMLGEKMSARQATVSRLEAGEPAVQIQTLMDALAALDLELVVRPRSKGDPRAFEDLF